MAEAMTELTRALEGIVGADHARVDGETHRYAVDGKAPTIVVLPGSAEEVSAALAACSKGGAAVVPWGGGTKMGLGRIPQKVDVVLCVSRLNRVLDHEPGDMTSTVQAGMVLSEYQSRLNSHGQFLALDPPAETRATIGGILATNVSGPRRLRYGAARDLLIGVRVAHADGTVTKGGAKVVKNVTGYDMNKLYVGSLGTLGVILEATFRLYPIPPTEHTWAAAFPTASKAREAIAKILDSPLVPNALELLNHSAALEVGRQSGIVPGSAGCLLAVAVASVPEAVRAQLEQARKIGRDAGANDGQMLEGEAHEKFWAAVRNFDAGHDGGIVLKASVLLDRLGDAVMQGERIAEELGLAMAIVAEAGTGIVRYYLRGEGVEADRLRRLAEAVASLRAFATNAKGSLVVLHAPPDIKARVDVWGPVGEALPLMRGLKQQFDPGGILNPGRFVEGL